MECIPCFKTKKFILAFVNNFKSDFKDPFRYEVFLIMDLV